VIEFGPFPVALGRPVPAQARGWVGRSGYAIAVRGDGEVSHTLRIASLLGLAGGESQRGGRGPDGFADCRIVGGQRVGKSCGIFFAESDGERRNCTTFVRRRGGCEGRLRFHPRNCCLRRRRRGWKS